MKLKLMFISWISSLCLGAVPPEGNPDGFSAMPALFNQAVFAQVAAAASGSGGLTGEVEVHLEAVQEVLHLYNASHFAVLGPGVMEDTRLLSLAPVLKKKVVFETSWPTYASPIHVALLKAGTGNWVMAANMGGDFFILENEHGFGLVRK